MLESITNESSAMGFIFFYSFLGIVFFVLLNILLAILVEAYMKASTPTPTLAPTPTRRGGR